MRKALGQYRRHYTLKEYHCTTRVRSEGEVHFETCEATVKVEVDGQPEYTVAEGDGPVNALDAALRKALLPFYPELAQVSLTDYKVRIIDSRTGTAAKTRVLIDSSDGQNTWGTVGVSYNIIEASWRALADSFDYYILRARGEG